jgi:hypothetical protein
MCSCKRMLLMGLLGLAASSPAMAWDYFSAGVDYRNCDPPVVVRERVYAPGVWVQRPCYPVIVPRSRVAITYVSPHRYRTGYYYVRPHGSKVIVRVR